MKNTEFMEKYCPALRGFFDAGRDGVYYLSHASIVVILNGMKFLFDPVLAKPPHLGSWLFYPEMKMDACLLDVDAVFVSHQHQDHFDVDFLRLLPKRVKIYIISGRPQFEDMLRDAGLDFIRIPEGKIFDMGGGISCVGITHEYNGIDSAIAISNGDFTVYHGNDCFVSNDKLEVVKKEYGRVDVACIPFAYVHWYPFLLDDVDDEWREGEANRLIKNYLDYGLAQIDYLDPQVAIPFGANMFYFDDVESPHNKAVVSPFDFKDYALEQGFGRVDAIKTLFAGDVVYSLGGGVLEICSTPFTKKDLMGGLDSYIKHIRINGTGFDAAEIDGLRLSDLDDVAFIADRIRDAGCALDHRIYISNIDHPEAGVVEIDLKGMVVKKVKEVKFEYPCHWFKLTNFAYKAYFSRKFTFNEIVASSRFLLSRKPNDYNIEVLRVVNNIL